VLPQSFCAIGQRGAMARAAIVQVLCLRALEPAIWPAAAIGPTLCPRARVMVEEASARAIDRVMAAGDLAMAGIDLVTATDQAMGIDLRGRGKVGVVNSDRATAAFGPAMGE
jgi:hypothetical protein